MVKEHKTRHNDGANILRGIAILMVIAFHTFSPVSGEIFGWSGQFRNFSLAQSQQLLWFYPVTFGWAGVSIFFVLSGFCIHLSYLNNGSFNVWRFFWQRFWRIYPAYFIALLVLSVFTPINIFSSSGAKQFFSHLLFLQNFNGVTFFGINPSFWSIAVEMQLYLLFPCLIFLRSRFGIIKCLRISLVIGMGWRVIAIVLWGIPEQIITPALTSPLVTWFDWSLGAFVAERFFYGQIAFCNKKLWLLFLMPLFIITTIVKPLTIFSFSVAALIAAVILDIVVYAKWSQHLWMKVLIFIANISYSIYLWHQPLMLPITHQITYATGSPIAAWLTFFAVIVVGSWISFRFIEQVGINIGSNLWKHAFRV